MGCEDMDCIRLTRDMIQWRVLVNTIMTLRVVHEMGVLLTGWATFSFLGTELRGISTEFLCTTCMNFRFLTKLNEIQIAYEQF
jgi:hypothetical protein